MLIQLAILLVISGGLLLVVGILIARQYTLRAKLLTAFLLIVLVSLGALSAFDSYIMTENLTRSANRILSTTARQYSDRLDEFNRSSLQTISTEARLPAITNFLKYKGERIDSRQNTLEILRALQSRQEGGVLSYALLGENGINLLDTVNDNIGRNESGMPYFRRAKKEGLATQSSVMFDDSNDAVMYYSSPVFDLAGRFRGVLRAQYKASILSELVTASRGQVGRRSFAILLDENNLRLVHGQRADLQYTLAKRINENRLTELKQKHLVPVKAHSDFAESNEWLEMFTSSSTNGSIFSSLFYGIGTDSFSASSSRLETMPWTLVYAQAQEVFLEPVDMQKRSALMLVAIIAIVVIFIMLGATQLLLGPVRRLTAVVENIGNGNRLVTAQVEANDEIGGLASAFNHMTQNINNLIVDLEEEINGHKLTADNLRKLSQAIEQSPVSVMITDLKGDIEYVNPEFSKSTGYSLKEVEGKNPRFLNSGHTQPAQFKNMWNAITTGQSWSGELYNRKKNGDLFWENVTISPIKNNQGKITHYLAIKEDISLRKDYEERLLYQANYDKLTELPNRSLAYDRLQQAVANAIREEKRIAVLYMDFDHFKNINDTLGHEAGDKFLIEMAKRLKSCVRDVDTVARLGGDEFLIMLVEIGGEHGNDDSEYIEAIQKKTRDIMKLVSKPCVIEDVEFTVSVSVGIAFFPRDGEDPHMLLRNADTAMYRSKRKERGTSEVFMPEMSDIIIKRVELDNKIRHALEDGRFYLKYQGLMDANTKAIVGAEALLRWEDEELGEVSPEVFVPLAEESGMIVEIGNWVLDTACADIKRWQQSSNNPDLYMAINLSGRQFRGKGITTTVASLLEKHNLTGGSLELEITERLLMKDIPEVISTLNQFKEMNIKLSIDDFGTGYSSLSYLKRFPFDVLKIDKSFVHDIGVDPDDAALCEAIIAMAHSLGLSVIGEGVENEEQYQFLKQRGTEVIQGYYVAKPMIFDEFKQFAMISEWVVETAT
jgi:diguanylate cyclase (GGDEF)-like protein/PAS domain S-box-containing protein